MMKGSLVLAIALSLFCAGGAIAARNDGGAILLHTNDTCSYSLGWDYCGDAGPYSAPLPATCAELVTTSTKDPVNDVAIVWAVAAFVDGSSPAVTGYQFGIYGDVPADWYTAFGPCPAGTAIEVPDATWPAPGTGTAIGAGQVITGQMFKIYWFAASSPNGVGATMSTGNYVNGDGHAEFVDDSSPPQVDFVFQFGTMGWGVPGSKECPTTLAGACCLQGWFKCIIANNAADCQTQGGIFLGVGTACDLENTCSACCYEDFSNLQRYCSMVPRWYCLDRYSESGSGGLYRNPSWSGLKQDGTGNVCAPSADSLSWEWWCDVVGTRTQKTSWGALKSLFR